MSRSEHGNARDKSDPRDRARKDRIKSLIVAERRHRDRALPAVTASAIPIEVREGPSVQFPASVRDLRGVMARLPAGTLNGLAGIELCPPEPPTYEIVHAARAPSLRGDYDTRTRRIRLFGYLYEPDLPERAILDTYLRLKMLETLVHEIGHHHDETTRVSRGRWRGDDDREPEADTFADRALLACVLPYLEDAHAGELAGFRCWLRCHGVVVVPLELLVGPHLFLFEADDAFESLLSSVMLGEPVIDAQIHFAFQLHYGGHFELALVVLDDVLARSPDHPAATKWRTHVVEHLANE
jgi:hypothetical protein